MESIELVGYAGNGEARWLWECWCGETKIATERSMLKYKCAHKRTRARSKNLPKQYDAAIRGKYSAYRQRGMTLSIEEFHALVTTPCTYCGLEPETYHGIDRIDSDFGYENGNIVACCWICNRMKNNMSVKEFLDHIEAVFRHNF
jgi:hypothetical protein